MMKTEPKELTDLQLVEAARKLIRSTDVKEQLPARHTLSDLWASHQAVQAATHAFFEKYGDRLKTLDPVAWRDLDSWVAMGL